MKPTIAIPILLVAALATMGFSAWSPQWSPARSPGIDQPTREPDASRVVSTKTLPASDVARPADEVSIPKRTKSRPSNPPTRSSSSDTVEIDCPLLKPQPFRRTLGYACLACISWSETNSPGVPVGSSRRASIEADQRARAQALDRLREHNVISAVDTRSSAVTLWVKDAFTSLDLESMQKVVDLVFTHCVVGNHTKNMVLIYNSATRSRIGTFTEHRGLRMVNQLAKR